MLILWSSNPEPACLLWVNGTHYRAAALLSASPQLAESIRAAKRFRVVPTADSCTATNDSPPVADLLDHLVGEREQIVRDFDAERLGSLEIDDQLELGQLHNRQIGGLFALEDSPGVDALLTIWVNKAGSIAHQAASCGE